MGVFQKGDQHSQLHPGRQRPNRAVLTTAGLNLLADGSVDCNLSGRDSGLLPSSLFQLSESEKLMKLILTRALSCGTYLALILEEDHL